MRQPQLVKKRTHRGGRVLQWYVATLSILALTFGVLVSQPTAAEAANITDGFDHTNIISDAQFYHGKAMTAAQVQSFLNKRVPRCTIGDAGRKAGSKTANGNTIASKCLRDFKMTTTSKAANSYCAAYSGKSGETAAQIIEKVGKACGISQRVLLVMLEKEQSLVTDTWPITRMYDYAMGWACPDDGPGNSANCDPASASFFTQVYKSAWQLKVYLYNPGWFNYRAGVNNTVQWHPNSSCGTSTFKIKNNATAALYIYTPYRPNAAALRAGWGTGDSCSSYGNRNFYNFWKTWFRAEIPVQGDIAKFWKKTGAEGGVYGYPTASRVFRQTKFAGGAWTQTFSGGLIVTEMKTGRTVGVPFGVGYNVWNGAGGIGGALGAPLNDPVHYSQNGGAELRTMQGGLIITRGSKGASLPYGPIYNRYNNDLNGIYGELGYPVSDATKYSNGVLQNFQSGFIGRADGQKTYTFMTHGPLFNFYNAKAGGIRGAFGFPVSDQVKLKSGKPLQKFEEGLLMQNQQGDIIGLPAAWANAYATAEEDGADIGDAQGVVRSLTRNGGARFMQFEGGVVVWPTGAKAPVAVSGDVFDAYNTSFGGFGGDLAYPTAGAREVNGGGTLQTFTGGLILQAAGHDAVGMKYSSDIYERYNSREGGIYGWLGMPISNEVDEGDSVVQQFEHGVIIQSSDGTITALPVRTGEKYISLGGKSGVLGKQTTPSRSYDVSDGGTLSFFDNGLIIETPDTVATMLYNSAIYRYYNSTAGGIYGKLGYPVGDVVVTNGVAVQKFQRGEILDENGKITMKLQ